MTKNKKAKILAAVVCASTVLALHPVDTAKAAPTLAPVSAPTVTLNGNSYGVSTQGLFDDLGGLLEGVGDLVGGDVLEPILKGLTETVDALNVKVGVLGGLLGVQIGEDGSPIIINNSYVIGSGDKNFEHMVVGEGGKFVANKDGSFGTLKIPYDPNTMKDEDGYLGKEENYVFHVDKDTGYIYASDGNFKTDVEGNVTAGTYNGIKISKVDAASGTDKAGDIKLGDINVTSMQNKLDTMKTYTAGNGIEFGQDGMSTLAEGDVPISIKTGAGLKIDADNSVAIQLKGDEQNLAVDKANGLSLNDTLKDIKSINNVTIQKNQDDHYLFGDIDVTAINTRTSHMSVDSTGTTVFDGDVSSTVKGKTYTLQGLGAAVDGLKTGSGSAVMEGWQYDKDTNTATVGDGVVIDGKNKNITGANGEKVTVNGVNVENDTEKGYIVGDVNITDLNNRTSNITGTTGEDKKDTQFAGDVISGDGSSLDTVADKVQNIQVDENGNIIGGIAGWQYDKTTNTATVANTVKVDGNEKNIYSDDGNVKLNGVELSNSADGYMVGNVNVSVVQKDVDSVKDKTQHITADKNGTHFDGNITASGDVTTGKGSSLDEVSDKLDAINGWDDDGNLIANKIAGWEYDEKTGTATIAGSININKNGTISATTNADSYLDLKQDYTELGYGDNKIHLDENGIGLEAGENTSTTVTDGKVETTVGNTTVTTTQDGTKFDNGESSTVVDGGNITTDNITTDNITTDNITTSTITAGNGNFTVDKDGNVTSGSVNGVQIGTNGKGDIIINGTDNNGEVIINGSNISSSTENIAGIDRVEDGENSTTVIENNTTIDNQGNLNTVNGNFEHQITVGGENGTLITNKDVTINKGTENEISLSQMGKVDNIDKELQSNSNYDGTVVGGLNAEANIRREQVSVLNNRVNSLENRIGNVEERIDKVGAMAAAIANLRTMGYDPEAPTEIAVGIGQYRSETGLALGVFHYPNEDFMLSASLSTSGDEVMGGIGATWKLGRKSEAEKAQDIETKRLKKAEEMKIAAQKSKVEAQKERHAKMLEERQNHKTA